MGYINKWRCEIKKLLIVLNLLLLFIIITSCERSISDNEEDILLYRNGVISSLNEIIGLKDYLHQIVDEIHAQAKCFATNKDITRLKNLSILIEMNFNEPIDLQGNYYEFKNVESLIFILSSTYQGSCDFEETILISETDKSTWSIFISKEEDWVEEIYQMIRL